MKLFVNIRKCYVDRYNGKKEHVTCEKQYTTRRLSELVRVHKKIDFHLYLNFSPYTCEKKKKLCENLISSSSDTRIDMVKNL